MHLEQCHTDDWARSADKRRPLFALAGLLYLLVALLRESAVRVVFDSHVIAAPDFPISHAIAVQAIQVALLAPVAWLLLASLLSGDESYRDAFRTRFRTVGAYLLLIAIASVVLNASALWPFSWRWESNGTAAYMQLLIKHDKPAAIALWAVAGIVLIPVIEESVFRFWLLRALARVTRSLPAAVIGSSLCFATLHLGNPLSSPDRAHIVNATWLFAFSILIGTITVRSRGNIAPALAMHVGRNALEFATLAFSVIAGYTV